jgi:hypothetical protein
MRKNSEGYIWMQFLHIRAQKVVGRSRYAADTPQEAPVENSNLLVSY